VATIITASFFLRAPAESVVRDRGWFQDPCARSSATALAKGALPASAAVCAAAAGCIALEPRGNPRRHIVVEPPQLQIGGDADGDGFLVDRSFTVTVEAVVSVEITVPGMLRNVPEITPSAAIAVPSVVWFRAPTIDRPCGWR